MPLAAALSSQVSPTIRDRGQEYFRSGDVTLEAVGPVAVAAIVYGSADYDVDLSLTGRTIVASCTCPYVYQSDSVCKHIWATVLAAESRGFAAGAAATGRLHLVLDGDDKDEADDDYDDEPPYPQYRSVWSPPPAPPGPARETWKDQLAALRRETQPASPDPGRYDRAAERQPVYVVDVTTSAQLRKLVLEVNVRERKKNGEWGKPRVQNLSAAQFDELADPLDRQILALLGGAERGDSYGYGQSYYGYGSSRYRLAGPLLDAVLPLLARTDRVRLRRDPRRPDLEGVTPDLDPPWELALAVTRGDAGKKWVLAGTLRRGDETMPLSEPALLVPGAVFWDGRFARLDDAGAFVWVPVLRRVGKIEVPVARADDLLGQLLQMPRLPRLDLPEELRYTEQTVPPRPRLVVKAAKQHYGTPLLHADLSFDYDGQVVPARPPGRGIYRPDDKRFLPRDPAAEQAAARELTRLGLRPGWSGGGETLELKSAQLPKLVRELVPAGWKVEAEGKLYRQAGEFKLTVHSDRDWFDLSATADFEGRSVPLPRLLEALNRGESTVVLDDGSLGMVPEDWLKKYGLIARMGTIQGDQVRFGRAQVGVLDALLASRPEITFDKQFARARDELRKFEGIAPADAPPGFKGELRGYQHEGLGWLRFLRKFGFGGCLADEMGLGKTVQVLAFLAGRRAGPALVVVPRSLVFNWKQEAARFAPRLKVLDHTGPARDRTGAGFKAHDIVLTTYGTLRNDAETFAGFRFDTCVLDESQAAKNAETETAKAVKLIQADHRLALSGTPVENHLGELWTLFDFLNPGMLGRAVLFGGGTGPARNPDAETREILARALRPFILRRTKDQVAKDLPAKTEQTVYCDLEPAQRRLYDELRDHYRQALLARVDAVGLGRSKIQVLEALLRLRQAACHPGLIDKKRTAETSAKLDVLLPQLTELAESGHKALVFSQFTSLLAIVRSRLDADGVAYEYLDGRTRDRAARVERFQTDPACRLFLVSLKAGGVGLNLTAAEYVFLLDPWWNPAVEAQAIDRTHRIGQTRPVFAYRLIARGTVEEKVLALQQSKRELADAILGGDGRLITDLKREDLELLLS
ncbi:MAG: SNF2-related protein [Gemmataceae bacterium]|nr:SNF2-related protein [Gemmataceae bacterium]